MGRGDPGAGPYAGLVESAEALQERPEIELAAFIGRAFSMDPVEALDGGRFKVAVRLAAAHVVAEAYRNPRPDPDAPSQ